MFYDNVLAVTFWKHGFPFQTVYIYGTDETDPEVKKFLEMSKGSLKEMDCEMISIKKVNSIAIAMIADKREKV